MVILDSGYEFVGWMIIEGDVMIENFGSLVIIVILYNDNSMIIVNFKFGVELVFIVCVSVNKIVLMLVLGFGFYIIDYGDGIVV